MNIFQLQKLGLTPDVSDGDDNNDEDDDDDDDENEDEYLDPPTRLNKTSR